MSGLFRTRSDSASPYFGSRRPRVRISPSRPGQSTCGSCRFSAWEPSASVLNMADHRKRGYGEDSIYFDHASECRDGEHHRSCSGRWRGSVSLGFGPDGRRLRRKVTGRTRTQVKDKLKDLHDELREGLRTSATYTVQNAVDDWLAHGLDGRSAKTISTNREVLAPLAELIGAAKLKELTAADV